MTGVRKQTTLQFDKYFQKVMKSTLFLKIQINLMVCLLSSAETTNYYYYYFSFNISRAYLTKKKKKDRKGGMKYLISLQKRLMVLKSSNYGEREESHFNILSLTEEKYPMTETIMQVK